MNYEALRAAHEADLRRSFDEYTCGQPADQFMDELFERLKSEPFPGENVANWIYSVYAPMAKAAKRVTPETEAAINEALENRDAILALPVPVPNWIKKIDDWMKLDCQLRIWFGDNEFIDYGLVADRFAA